jgi:hypothetical protein
VRDTIETRPNAVRVRLDLVETIILDKKFLKMDSKYRSRYEHHRVLALVVSHKMISASYRWIHPFADGQFHAIQRCVVVLVVVVSSETTVIIR